jgi:hypothetical protein
MIKKCILSFLLLSFTGIVFSQSAVNNADSIILQVLKFRSLYGEYIREYDAYVYIKGNTQVKKKNFLAKYAPNFLYWNKKADNSFVEAIVDVHFTAPNHFTQELKALNGDRLNADDIRERVMQFLNVNIYNPTIFNNQILLPGVRDVFHYYRFEYVTSFDTLQHKIHQIRVIPKINSQKLLSGDFYIVDDSWTIFRFDIRGKWELFDFQINTEFGLKLNNFLLPLKSEITFHLNLLGNETVNRYYSKFEYESVKQFDWQSRPKPVNYDLSNYFNVLTDSVPIIKDSVFWQKNRPVPLTAFEKSLLKNRKAMQQQADSAALAQQSWKFSKGLVIPKKFQYSDTYFTYSGLLNPLKLAYSKLDGIVYWQQFKIYKQYEDGCELRFTPDLGILLQKKEVYFRTPVSWLFAPEKFGVVDFIFGNRNQSYNSTIIDQINRIVSPDSINFNDFNLEYYRHYYADLQADYEITNGLLIYGGLHYDWYVPVRNKTSNENPLKAPGKVAKVIQDNDVIDIVNNQYRIFAPVVGLQWTPGQFYRINGKKKEYLDSRFPTFRLEYARGIKGLFDSNSNYERVELDLQQKLRLGLMRSLHYYLGAGWFTNTKSVYFADFSNFQRQNIPQSWNDPIGGTFHLLDGVWYNASKSYIQAHFMYESPFAILQLFRNINTDIVNERLYISQLYIPRKQSSAPEKLSRYYTEIGYGIGNFLGNAGVFVSFNQGKYESIGTRFSFELGQ